MNEYSDLPEEVQTEIKRKRGTDGITMRDKVWLLLDKFGPCNAPEIIAQMWRQNHILINRRIVSQCFYSLKLNKRIVSLGSGVYQTVKEGESNES